MSSYHCQERGEMGTEKARGQEGRLEEPWDRSKKGQGHKGGKVLLVSGWMGSWWSSSGWA